MFNRVLNTPLRALSTMGASELESLDGFTHIGSKLSSLIFLYPTAIEGRIYSSVVTKAVVIISPFNRMKLLADKSFCTAVGSYLLRKVTGKRRPQIKLKH